MKSSAQNRILVGVVLSFVIILVVWFSVSSVASEQTPSSSLLTAQALQGSGASGVDADVVATLLQLRAITLSGTIFSDPSFSNLVDFGTEIMPEPIGRENPFESVPLKIIPDSRSSSLFSATPQGRVR